MIWFRPYHIDELHSLGENTMGAHLGMEFVEIGEDFLKAKMPVNSRTKQPAGLLHGGASVALAETLGSVAAWMCLDNEKFYPVGLEINANHIRSVTKDFVYGTATVLHLGKTTQVWDIKIRNELEKLVCVSRITMAVLKK